MEIEEDLCFVKWYRRIDHVFNLWLKAIEGGHHVDQSLTPHMVYVIDHRVGAVYHGVCACAGSTSSVAHCAGATCPAVGGTDKQ
jgi:hypothetical protein